MGRVVAAAAAGRWTWCLEGLLEAGWRCRRTRRTGGGANREAGAPALAPPPPPPPPRRACCARRAARPRCISAAQPAPPSPSSLPSPPRHRPHQRPHRRRRRRRARQGRCRIERHTRPLRSGLASPGGPGAARPPGGSPWRRCASERSPASAGSRSAQGWGQVGVRLGSGLGLGLGLVSGQGGAKLRVSGWCVQAVDLPLLGFGLLLEHRGVAGGVLRRLLGLGLGLGLGA